MTVGELKERLDALDDDLLVVVNEYCGPAIVETTELVEEPRGWRGTVEIQ